MSAEPADPVANFDCDPRYDVQKMLGQGSYGVVCSAVDSKTGEMVAIKKMSNVFSHPLETKRTLRELRLLRHFIDHENVLTISNVILPMGQDMLHRDIFVVTELMDTDLDQVIRSQQPLSMMHVQTFLYQILRGLQYIHAANVIHRDLKPGNILVNQNCTVKICDFGLARLEPETGYGGFMTEYVVTRWYRAPEIMLSGQDYNQSIDVWATGCILAEMLLRRPIFPGKNYVDQVRVIVDVIGNPTESGLMMIEDKEARDYVRTLPHKPALDFSVLGLEESIGCTTEEAVAAGALVQQMLIFDPKCRKGVVQAMDHPLLQTVRSQDTDVFKPCPQFKFDFEREEKEEELLELMLQETEHYKRMDYELDAANAAAFGDADGYGLPADGFGGIPPDEPFDDGIGFGGIPDQWEHQPMQSEPSPNEAFNPLNGFDPLGEEQYEIPEEYLANATEWGNQPFDPRDSLQFLQKPDGPVPPFGDAKYNTMIAINQRLMVGDVDETQWGTKLLTPVCEERSHEIEKEKKQFASVLAQERASMRAKEHQARASQQKQKDTDLVNSQLPPRRRVKDMGSDGTGTKKSSTKSKTTRANSAGKARPSSSTSGSSRPRSAMASSSKKDKSFMPPIPQRSKRKDPLPAAAKVAGKNRNTTKRASSASKGRPASSTTRKPTVSQSRKTASSSTSSATDTVNEKARLQGLLNSLQQRATDELASSRQ